MYTASSYLICCVTNLHAGSGDTSYGIIDKMVQRDPVTELPSIYASSLKGAFREWFKHGPEKDQLENGLIDRIFGKDVRKENAETDGSKGDTIFHEAQLLGLTVRSNQKPFFLATTRQVLSDFIEKAKLFNLSFNALKKEVESLHDIADRQPKILGTQMPQLMIEDYGDIGGLGLQKPELERWLGENILLMSDTDFKRICSDYSLPVIARNNLENGESKNLWYEQIVPHQSRFGFFTVKLSGEDVFAQKIDGKTVQIGANSSLGYGFCKITKKEPA